MRHSKIQMALQHKTGTNQSEHYIHNAATKLTAHADSNIANGRRKIQKKAGEQASGTRKARIEQKKGRQKRASGTNRRQQVGTYVSM